MCTIFSSCQFNIRTSTALNRKNFHSICLFRFLPFNGTVLTNYWVFRWQVICSGSLARHFAVEIVCTVIQKHVEACFKDSNGKVCQISPAIVDMQYNNWKQRSAYSLSTLGYLRFLPLWVS